MVTKHTTQKKKRRTTIKDLPEESLWARLAKIGESIPREEWEKLPKDLSKNFDHYAHGSPKQE